MAKIVDHFAVGACQFGEVVHRPIAGDASGMPIDLHVLAGAKLSNAAEKRAVEEGGMEVEILIDCLGIGVARNLRIFEQSFNLACEDDSPAVVVEIYLLDSQRIARQRQRLVSAVPKAESEDAGCICEGVGTIVLQQAEQRFGVGGTSKAAAMRCQPGPEVRVIIEFAVISDPARAVVVGQR